MSGFFLSILFLGVPQYIYEPQFTPICIGFLENMDNSWYRYFLCHFHYFMNSVQFVDKQVSCKK